MTTPIYIMTLVGVVAFAVSGVIEARRKQMDLVGISAAAFLTAFGGGTVRDILLGRYPIFWVTEQSYVAFVLVIAVVAFFVSRRMTLTPDAIAIPDAIGLGVFSATGTQIAADLNVPVLIAIVMGVITGSVGGVLRDVVCNEIPAIFARTQLYATCAALGAIVYLASRAIGADTQTGLIAGSVATIALRLAAIRLNLRLPA